MPTPTCVTLQCEAYGLGRTCVRHSSRSLGRACMNSGPSDVPLAFGRFALPSGALEVAVALSPVDAPTILTTGMTTAYTCDSSGHHTFRSPVGVVHVRGAPFRPHIPSSLEPLISGCFGIVLTVVPHSPLNGVLATCRRVGPDFNVRWTGPESGEHLDAMSWTDGTNSYCLGTADGELLSAVAYRGISLPCRHEGRYDLGTVRYLPDGLQVPLAELLPNDPCTIHFACAWSDSSSPDAALASWFAVDTCPAAILATEA